VLLLAVVPRSARADGEPKPDVARPSVAPPPSSVDAASVLLFVGGALSGLTLHELGHVLTNLAYGNVPGLSSVSYLKVIPWFSIDARLTYRDGVYYKADGSVFRAGGRGYYVINMGGFMMQNLGSEIILTTHPDLRDEHAPFAKGLLFMNIGLSLGYSTASFVGLEDPHGDISGGSRHTYYPAPLIAGMVFTSGALDLFRYLFPDDEMLPWLSRSAKAMFLGMDIPLE
jgi:hypothetical protein